MSGNRSNKVTWLYGGQRPLSCVEYSNGALHISVQGKDKDTDVWGSGERGMCCELTFAESRVGGTTEID